MKFAIAALLVLSFQTQTARAEADARQYYFDCKLAKLIDDNVFEEGLSRHEYPDVYAVKEGKETALLVGAMMYSNTSGDRVEISNSPTSISVTGVPKEAARTRDFWTKVTVAKSAGKDGKRWGTISVKDGGELKKIALVVCK